jgi:hypothetical protein
MKGDFRFEISGGRAGEKALPAKQKTSKKSGLPGAIIRILARSFKRKVTPLSGGRQPECKISGSLPRTARKTGSSFDRVVSPAVK